MDLWKAWHHIPAVDHFGWGRWSADNLETPTQIRRHFHRDLEKFTHAEEFLQHLELPIRVVQE